MESANASCPLCEYSAQKFLPEKGKICGRNFFHCSQCDLVFVDPAQLPSRAEEARRYAEHENNPSDPRYRAFLKPALDALQPLLPPGASGLDYGSGPGPALSEMFKEAGFTMENYDPIFHPGTLDGKQFDFLTCTEVAEHFHRPKVDFAKMAGLLKPGGTLVVMTRLLGDWMAFPNWYYQRDPTHVSFYSRQSLEWIAKRFRWEAFFPSANLVLFRT